MILPLAQRNDRSANREFLPHPQYPMGSVVFRLLFHSQSVKTASSFLNTLTNKWFQFTYDIPVLLHRAYYEPQKHTVIELLRISFWHDNTRFLVPTYLSKIPGCICDGLRLIRRPCKISFIFSATSYDICGTFVQSASTQAPTQVGPSQKYYCRANWTTCKQ